MEAAYDLLDIGANVTTSYRQMDTNPYTYKPKLLVLSG